MAEKQPSGFQFELVGGEMIKCSHIYCEVCLVYQEEKIFPKEERSNR